MPFFKGEVDQGPRCEIFCFENNANLNATLQRLQDLVRHDSIRNAGLPWAGRAPRSSMHACRRLVFLPYIHGVLTDACATHISTLLAYVYIAALWLWQKGSFTHYGDEAARSYGT